uniref:hypothetical protein n=1 Tax=Saccharothrix espanaensis TaxID=103731 RepID=UPI003F492547
MAQSSTGDLVKVGRRWLRPVHARRLTLGDLRALHARVAALALPTEDYVLRAHVVPGSNDQAVYSVAATPADPRPEQ